MNNLMDNCVRVILIRHGETVFNQKHYMQGWSDSELTENAVRLTRERAQELAQFDIEHAYTSDLGRSIQTCRILFEELNISQNNINQLPMLREFNYGYFESKSEKYLTEEIIRWIKRHESFITKLKMKFSNDKEFKAKTIINTIAALDHKYHPNNPNPVLNAPDSYKKITETIEDLKLILKKHPNETVLIVSHGHFLITLIYILFNKQATILNRIDNLSGFELYYSIDTQTFDLLKQI